MFRGFWLELPENGRNPHWGKLNPQVRARQKDPGGWESEILTFTTNAIMHKATSEIFYSPPWNGDPLDILCAENAQLWGASSGGRQLTTTGGGAWVEACFWVKEPPAQTQWRIGGRCYLLALGDIENVNLQYVKEVRRRIEERVCYVLKDAEGRVSYREEILAHFSNLSPGLRASFAGGEEGDVDGVGQVRSGEPLPEGYKLPATVIGLSNEETLPAEFGGMDGGRGEVARKYFRVGVIIPERVDRVDLGERGGAGRRWVYTLEGQRKEDRRWVEREVWP